MIITTGVNLDHQGMPIMAHQGDRKIGHIGGTRGTVIRDIAERRDDYHQTGVCHVPMPGMTPTTGGTHEGLARRIPGVVVMIITTDAGSEGGVNYIHDMTTEITIATMTGGGDMIGGRMITDTRMCKVI